MLYAIMIFITEVWSGLCKTDHLSVLKPLRSFGPTQRGPTLVSIIILVILALQYVYIRFKLLSVTIISNKILLLLYISNIISNNNYIVGCKHRASEVLLYIIYRRPRTCKPNH